MVHHNSQINKQINDISWQSNHFIRSWYLLWPLPILLSYKILWTNDLLVILCRIFGSTDKKSFQDFFISWLWKIWTSSLLGSSKCQLLPSFISCLFKILPMALKLIGSILSCRSWLKMFPLLKIKRRIAILGLAIGMVTLSVRWNDLFADRCC